jgi:hypothetical protein
MLSRGFGTKIGRMVRMGVEPEVSGPWGYAIRQISSHNHSVSSLCVPSRKPQLFCRLSPNLLYPVYLCS